MEQHGQESYFVLGEGLLGETEGGRAPAFQPAAAAPPFRFSRLGPRGTGRQLTRASSAGSAPGSWPRPSIGPWRGA